MKINAPQLSEGKEVGALDEVLQELQIQERAAEGLMFTNEILSDVDLTGNGL